jgi:orotidine-5'-phosphate decarboxylase
VFLDLKLHDIPNTGAGAVAAAAALGVDYLTVHAGGGEAMLRAASAAAPGRLRVLAVTVLTSLDDEALRGLDLPGGVEQRVERWTRLALEAGCAGVVCSPVEAARLRPLAPRPFLLVTPGIRGAGEDAGDQRRTASPREALADGADLLVIGRPLTRAADPLAALDRLAAELLAANR